MSFYGVCSFSQRVIVTDGLKQARRNLTRNYNASRRLRPRCCANVDVGDVGVPFSSVGGVMAKEPCSSRTTYSANFYNRRGSLSQKMRTFSTLPCTVSVEDEETEKTAESRRTGRLSNVIVTDTKSAKGDPSLQHHLENDGLGGVHPKHSSKYASSSPAIITPETELVDSLLRHTSTLVDLDASNIIAYSGGVDSSLTAALVYQTFTSQSTCLRKSTKGHARAILGVSPAVPLEQIELARQVAKAIGIDYLEIPTFEGQDPEYVRNDGRACFICKTHLYSTLRAVSDHVISHHTTNPVSNDETSGGIIRSNHTTSTNKNSVILYNGTNADDTQDPTRLGLLAASQYSVASPLIHTTKSDVRRAAKHLGLPNWNYAAAPCLRSRLALGVQATQEHLRVIDEAERHVRKALQLDSTKNLRVRMLAGNRAMIEIDDVVSLGTEEVEDTLRQRGFETLFQKWGFRDFGVRTFRSGSVAGIIDGRKQKPTSSLNVHDVIRRRNSPSYAKNEQEDISSWDKGEVNCDDNEDDLTTSSSDTVAMSS